MALNITSEYLSSNLISDSYFIATIYSFVKEAGKRASESRNTIDNSSNVCYVSVGATKRTGCTEIVDKRISMIYNPNDLFIIGGAALNIYDKLLNRKANSTTRITTVDDFLKRKTEDIDLKWWPRITLPFKGIVLTAFSKALTIFATEFEKNLNEVFIENKDDISTNIHLKYPDLELDTFEILVERLPYNKYGNETIKINFNIGSYTFKICEITLYDGTNSQLSHNIQPMTSDIYYSNPISGYNKLIRGAIGWKSVINSSIIKNYINGKLSISNIKNTNTIRKSVVIALPQLQQFIQQQLYTIRNLLQSMNRKSFVNYKRLIYIKELLKTFNLNTSITNTKLFTNIVSDKIKNNNTLLRFINKELNDIISENKEGIISLCKYIKEDDIILTELCNKAMNISTKSGGRFNNKTHKRLKFSQ